MALLLCRFLSFCPAVILLFVFVLLYFKTFLTAEKIAFFTLGAFHWRGREVGKYARRGRDRKRERKSVEKGEIEKVFWAKQREGE